MRLEDVDEDEDDSNLNDPSQSGPSHQYEPSDDVAMSKIDHLNENDYKNIIQYDEV